MQVLALDIGKKRTGIASGNTKTSISTPVKVLPTQDVLNFAPSWKTLLEDYMPNALIIGLPYSMDGTCGKHAQEIRRLGEKITTRACLPCEFVDERLSSSEAKNIMHTDNITERKMRGKLDMLAASLFLQTWLDNNRE